MAKKPATPRKPEAPRGAILRPSAAISEEYSAAVLRELERMHKETVRVISQVWRDAPPVMDSAMDASAGSQARIALNALTTKYDAIFKRLAKRASERMISRTIRNSAVTLGMSIKEAAKEVTLDTYFLTDRLQDIVTASTQEAANLIKLIPQRYLGAVQGEVMRSITAGNGLQDLVPQLTARYQGDVRHARLVAMDQTRKAYSNITAGRMSALGFKRYEWIHSGGSQHPRKDHQEMHGNVYSLDDPPVIDKRTGERGIPGVAINCRCSLRPLISFEDDTE